MPNVDRFEKLSQYDEDTITLGDYWAANKPGDVTVEPGAVSSGAEEAAVVEAEHTDPDMTAPVSYPRPNWQEQKNCVGMPLDFFFPQTGNKDHLEQIRKVCRDCPVIEDCRAFNFGLLNAISEVYVIFAGMSGNEQRAFIRQRNRLRKEAEKAAAAQQAAELAS